MWRESKFKNEENFIFSHNYDFLSREKTKFYNLEKHSREGFFDRGNLEEKKLFLKAFW